MSKRLIFSKLRKSRTKIGLFILGLAALIWFLIRVIPKPSRASYPCQRAAFPIASGFVIWLISALSIKVLFTKFRQKLSQANYSYASILFILCLFTSGIQLFTPSLRSISAAVFSVQEEFIPIDSANTPVGVARGIFPGRVVWSHNPDATSWDGETGFWWESSETNKSIDSTLVRSMLSRSILKLTGATSGPEAWNKIFVYYNSTHGKGQVGYTPGEKIAIKANFNTQQSQSQMDNDIFASPAVVLSLLRLLINEGGVPDSAITVYDITRNVPDLIYNDCKKDFPGVHFIDISGGANGREPFTLDIEKPIQWSGSVDGQTTYLPLHVTGADYMINIANLKGHSLAGVTMHAKNHFGTYACDPTGKRGPVLSGAHRYVAVHEFEDGTLGTLPERPMGSYNLLTDLMGHEDLGEKTILFLMDALYTTGRQHVNVSLDYKMQMPPFDNDWMSSIFLSLDGVAIESVGLDFLRSEPGAVGTEMIYGQVDNYLHEAALANDPPSGTIYDPEGDGTLCNSLGVHEHWNDPVNKQYSRNLETGEGIELVDDSPTVISVEVPDTLTAYLGSTPTLDGYIDEGEYSDAQMISGPQGWIEPGTEMTDDSCDLAFKVWYKHDGNYLYFAFDVSDTIIYAFDTERWVPDKFPNSNALERTVGRPFFGDGIEIFMNATNRNDETASIGDGTFWQTILSTHKSYFGGLEYGGLIQGIPYTEYAWENYENWYDNEYMKSAVRIKSKEEGRGYVAEWRISPDPCLQVHETDSVFVDFSKENMLGINIEFQDVDKKETSNVGGFEHVVYYSQEEGIHKKYAKSFATLLITPEAMNPDTSTTGIIDSHLDVSSANYPNPFSVTTTIPYQKLQASHTNLSIYNLNGQHIATLVNSHQTYGAHSVDWNGTDTHKRNVPDGVYFYILTSGDTRISGKMMLLR